MKLTVTKENNNNENARISFKRHKIYKDMCPLNKVRKTI